MRNLGARSLLGGLLLAAVCALGACGEEGALAPPRPPEVNRSTWQSVFKGVLAALASHDLDALHALLTPVGRQTLEQDLRAFCALLASPTQGPRLMAKVRLRWPEVPAALVEGARAGDLRSAWSLFMRAATPADVAPVQAGLKIDPTRPDETEVLYRYGAGSEQPVLLRRVKGVWAVERLSLGSG